MGFVAFGPSKLRIGEGVEAEKLCNGWLLRPCRIHLVGFPSAQGHGANAQLTSDFGLQAAQLQSALSQMAADGRRRVWDWYPSVFGGQILAS